MLAATETPTGKSQPEVQKPLIASPLNASLESQLKNCLHNDKRSNRWPHSLKMDVLPTFCVSRRAYDRLRGSNSFELPSPSTLSRLKNTIKQTPGLNPSMMGWMHQAALAHGTDRQGGLLFDEMKIQEALLMKDLGDTLELGGLVDLGERCNIMQSSTKINTDSEKAASKSHLYAKHILQLHFISFDGFRFPVSFYPVSTANGTELYVVINEALQELYRYDFHVCFLSCDGASTNRNLYKTFQTPSQKHKVYNPMDPGTPLILYSDYSHVIKRVRNCLEKSELNGKKVLTLNSE
jgi:hypothetical protein